MDSAMKTLIWLCAAAAMGAVLRPVPAQAGIDACGDIHVEANAQCEVVPPGATCEAMCTPVSVRAACAAQLAAECQADCTDLPSVECDASCSASCEAECEVDPGQFNCQAACQADCSGRCEAHCEGDSDGAACMARCEGSCSASCDASCELEPPQADCEASCEASCEGSCEADANFDCQATCQVAAEADCEFDVQGGCEAECQTQEGALFCDGQYVDHGDNLQSCIDALRTALDIEVEAHSSGEAGCTDGAGCMAHGEASARVSSDCSVTAPGSPRRGWAGAGLGLLLFAGVVRSRHKRRA